MDGGQKWLDGKRKAGSKDGDVGSTAGGRHERRERWQGGDGDWSGRADVLALGGAKWNLAVLSVSRSRWGGAVKNGG